ncbi:MAG TPA: 50S ribosomal protein L25 [Polyangiaceae bacterium]|nr:50S ribosomal protein L25 [Polyangiaceae bacterium]
MQLNKVSASTRTQSGKGVARRLRASGQIPAVAYSKGQAAQHLAVPPEQVVAALTSKHGRNSVLEIEVDGSSKLTAMIREYQYHPVSRALLHADFIEVSESEPVQVNVPLVLTGKPKGVVLGGKLRQVFRELPLLCAPSAIPVELVHDITEVGIDGHVAASDIQLPAGVSIQLPPKQTLASIHVDRKAKAEEEAEKEKEAAKEAAKAGKK